MVISVNILGTLAFPTTALGECGDPAASAVEACLAGACSLPMTPDDLAEAIGQEVGGQAADAQMQNDLEKGRQQAVNGGVITPGGTAKQVEDVGKASRDRTGEDMGRKIDRMNQCVNPGHLSLY